MRIQIAIVLSLLLTACGAAAPKSAIENRQSQIPAGQKRPNILLIVADDLGYADIGAQQISKDVKTPNIDSIATNGVRFTNAYVSCPVCSPTRAGLMTGRYQQRFGHEFNPGGNDPAVFGLPLSETTLPQHLKKSGYATGMVGKWHLGSREGYLPTDRGFDSFYGFLGGAHPYTNLSGKGKNPILRETKPVDEKEYLTDAFAREAVSFIGQQQQDKPFFLYLAFNAIHNPQEAPAKYTDRFSHVADKKRKLALAMLSAMDDAVGLVLSKLRASGMEENTLIIFHTDNGGPTPGNGSLNTPLSGFKGQVWEGGIRVPFLVQWKNHIAPRTIDHPVIQLDVFPTACAAANVDAPNNLDGVNLMPLLTGQSMTTPHETLYWRFSPQSAVRHGDYKLVKFGDTPAKLFDLSKDAGEKTDLSAANPQIVKELQTKLDAWSGQLMKPRWNQKDKFQDNVESDAAQESKAQRKQRRQPPATRQRT